MLDIGFDIDAVGGEGRSTAAGTALHAAALDGNVALVRELLARGANPTILDPEFNSTPRGWAEFVDQQQIVEILDE